jgi:hypothetical protein
MAAVTSRVSVLYGHGPLIEDTVLLSAVYAIGTAARYRQIWQQAYKEVRWFNQYLRRYDGRQSRGDYEQLADQLGNLEFDLSFSAQPPVRRIEDFDIALYEALGLPGQGAALNRMVKQLNSSLNFSFIGLDIRHRRATEHSSWGTVALGVAATIAVPAAVVLEFFATDPVQGRSMWHGFAPVYLAAALFALIPLAVTLTAFGRALPSAVRARVRARRETPPGSAAARREGRDATPGHRPRRVRRGRTR